MNSIEDGIEDSMGTMARCKTTPTWPVEGCGTARRCQTETETIRSFEFLYDLARSLKKLKKKNYLILINLYCKTRGNLIEVIS